MGGVVSDVQAVRDIHISYSFSLEYTDNITLRILGFIPVPFMEAQHVNLNTHNSICDTVHQKALHKPGVSVRDNSK